MGVVKGQGHIVSPVSYWFTSLSFHIKQTNNSWDTAISKFHLETSKYTAADEVEKNWKHKVTPDLGDFIKEAWYQSTTDRMLK